MSTPADAAPQPAAPTGRAGRNLPAAVAVGVTLAGLVLVPLGVYPPAFVAVVALAVAFGTHEVVTAFATTAHDEAERAADPQRWSAVRLPYPPLALGAVGMVVAAYRAGAEGLVVALFLTVLAVTAYRVLDPAPGLLREIATSTLVAVYVGFLAGFAMLLLAADHGAARVILFVATTAASDIGGYAAGVFIGRHPMAPSVSPKKSWEGTAGSAVVCAAVSGLLFPLLLHAAVWQGVVFGLAIMVSAVLGDLLESMIKRDVGVKDMGSLLPGHGGLMDRLDSLLLSAPVAWLLLSLFV
ncbi:MAG TPA: phosphatidate cytidylyltransferase [Frankiaceae bacterium]